MNIARFSSMRVATRLSLSFAALGLMLALTTGVAFQRMAVMGEKSNDLADNWLPSVELVNKMNTLISDFRIAEFRHVVSTEATDMTEAERHLADIGKQLASHEADYIKLIGSDKERALHAQFAETWKRYLALHERMLAESRQNRTEQARALLDGESRQVYGKASAILLDLVQLNHEGGDLAGREAHDAHQSALWTMGCVGTLSLVMAVALAVILTRSITAPLREAVSVAQQVASGDLLGHRHPTR